MDFERVVFVGARDKLIVFPFCDPMHLDSRLRLNNIELAALAEHSGFFLHFHRTSKAR
jgi:hypothetical protein